MAIVAGPFAPEDRIPPVGQLLLAALHGRAARFPSNPRAVAPGEGRRDEAGTGRLVLIEAKDFNRVTAEDERRIKDCIRAGDVEATSRR